MNISNKDSDSSIIYDFITTALKFALEYTIKKAQEKQVGLKLNGTHQLLVYADDVNLLGDNMNTGKDIPVTCCGGP
jgi:hypothetical protein